MKKHTTIKSIKASYKTFYCGYCDLQYIMKYNQPQFYNSGVYGWNCDIYTNGYIAICTGYRNMTGKKIPDELIENYTARAKAICEANATYTEAKPKLDELVNKFYNELANL